MVGLCSYIFLHCPMIHKRPYLTIEYDGTTLQPPLIILMPSA